MQLLIMQLAMTMDIIYLKGNWSLVKISQAAIMKYTENIY